MVEAKISNCTLLSILILALILFVWTVNTIATANPLNAPTAISAFSA